MDSIIRLMERKINAGEHVSETQLERFAQYDSFLSDTLAERKHDRIVNQMRLLWAVTRAFQSGSDYYIGQFVNDDYHVAYGILETTQHGNETIHWRHKGWADNGKVVWERVRPVCGPRQPYIRDLIGAIASHFGFTYNKSWGDKHGTATVWGLTFHLRPKGKGSHRLKVECPACGKHYGPSKWRQHAEHKHPEHNN